MRGDLPISDASVSKASGWENPQACDTARKDMTNRFMVLLFAGLALSALMSLDGCVGRSVDHATQREGMKQPSVGTPRLHAHYEIVLVAIERSTQAEERYGVMVITHADSSPGSMNMAEDQLMKLIWLPPEGRLPFVLVNKEAHAITIPWDDAAYVDGLGRTHRVLHSSVRVWNPGDSQVPSMVLSQDRLADFLLPIESAQLGRNAWTSSPLFPCTQGLYCDQQAALAHQGLTYQVLLPLRVGLETFRYVFTFRVKTVEIRRD